MDVEAQGGEAPEVQAEPTSPESVSDPYEGLSAYAKSYVERVPEDQR